MKSGLYACAGASATASAAAWAKRFDEPITKESKVYFGFRPSAPRGALEPGAERRVVESFPEAAGNLGPGSFRAHVHRAVHAAFAPSAGLREAATIATCRALNNALGWGKRGRQKGWFCSDNTLSTQLSTGVESARFSACHAGSGLWITHHPKFTHAVSRAASLYFRRGRSSGRFFA